MIYYLPLYRVLSGILTARRKPLLSSITFLHFYTSFLANKEWCFFVYAFLRICINNLYYFWVRGNFSSGDVCFSTDCSGFERMKRTVPSNVVGSIVVG